MTIPHDPNSPADPKAKPPWDQLGVGAPYGWKAPSFGAEAQRAINTPDGLAAFARLLERQQLTQAELAQAEAQQQAAQAELARQQQETQRLQAEADAEQQRRQNWIVAQEQARQQDEYLGAHTSANRATVKAIGESTSTFVGWGILGFGLVSIVMLIERAAKKKKKKKDSKNKEDSKDEHREHDD